MHLKNSMLLGLAASILISGCMSIHPSMDKNQQADIRARIRMVRMEYSAIQQAISAESAVGAMLVVGADARNPASVVWTGSSPAQSLLSAFQQDSSAGETLNAPGVVCIWIPASTLSLEPTEYSCKALGIEVDRILQTQETLHLLAADIDRLDVTDRDLKTRIDNLASKIEVMVADIGFLSSGLATALNASTLAEQQVRIQAGAVEMLQEAYAGIAGHVSESNTILQNMLETITQQANNLDGKLTALQERMNQIQ